MFFNLLMPNEMFVVHCILVRMIYKSVLILMVLGSVQINVSAVTEKLYVLVLMPFDKGNVRIKLVNQVGAYVALDLIRQKRIINPDEYEVRIDIVNDFCDGTKSLKAALHEYFTKSQHVSFLHLTDFNPPKTALHIIS